MKQETIILRVMRLKKMLESSDTSFDKDTATFAKDISECERFINLLKNERLERYTKLAWLRYFNDVYKECRK